MRRPVSARAEAVLLIEYALFNVRELILDPWVIDNIAKLSEIDGVIDDIGWIWVESICAIVRAQSYNIVLRHRCIDAILSIKGTDPVETNVIRFIGSPRACSFILEATSDVPDDDFTWLIQNMGMAIMTNIFARM